MRLRRVPTSVHGIVDYVTAPVLIAAPDIFRMRQVSAAAIAPRVTGAAAAAYSATGSRMHSSVQARSPSR